MIESTQSQFQLPIKNNDSTLTKEKISYIKNTKDSEIYSCLQHYQDNLHDLLFIFENFGHLPKDFNYDLFLPYLTHKNDNIRYWAAKNIGKSKSEKYLKTLLNCAANEHSSMVKREVISSVGRMKSRLAIPYLTHMLGDPDPKIVAQVIRALLVFKGDPVTDNALSTLKEHENEMIRTVIHKEYFSNQSNPSGNTQSHTMTYDYLKNVVVNADVREVLKLIPNECIHLTFTSPPYYNARDYSIYPSYDAYLNFLEEVFREIYRLTKEGRYLIVNTSPVIIPRISRAHSSKRYPIPFDLHNRLTKIGWEFIDDIVWMKPEYSVKNRIGGFLQHRKPLAYKPNSVTEYLMVYRKKTDKLIDWNIKQYPNQIVEESKIKDEFETTNVWQICPKSDKIHSAVFPDELCKRVIQYYSFKGDLVFDPFAGSGTLGWTAKKMQRDFFLTENNEVYFEYMKKLKANTAQIKHDQTRFLTLNKFKEMIKNDIDRPGD